MLSTFWSWFSCGKGPLSPVDLKMIYWKLRVLECYGNMTTDLEKLNMAFCMQEVMKRTAIGRKSNYFLLSLNTPILWVNYLGRRQSYVIHRKICISY